MEVFVILVLTIAFGGDGPFEKVLRAMMSSFNLSAILTLCGWVPGVIAALVILNNPGRFVLKHNSNAKKK